MACFALFPRTRLYCSNCGKNVGTERITNLICSRKLGGCVSSTHSTAPAARRAHGSSAEHAMRDLIASHAPLRDGTHKVRQASSKTLTPGIQGAAAPWHAFLPYLSSCNERWGPRRAYRKENARKKEKRKITPPEVASCRTRLVNPQNNTIAPPEVVTRRTRPVKTQSLTTSH